MKKKMTYSLSGLVYGKHTVTLELVDGTFSVDMIGILGKVY